ncbi:PP2C family protein-serine/threonine phosphatase [Runella sp.]|uniref:PP2C family protein-serine/threonine phosphatase n=1 Tax=Runella sp. TaxID=1960881 RepID=UPI003D09E1CE
MPYSIYPPLGFTFQGQRENNEDSVYPEVGAATVQNRFFIVCDGVGGAQKGELASHIAVSGFAEYLNNHTSADFSEEVIDEALTHVQKQFDEMLAVQHLLKGMATTFTLVAFGEDAVHVGHIGDSRIYQIRNGTIVYKSEDHSKVNFLLKSGLISAEQAQNHPERNVIMRAIQGSHKDTQMEIHTLTDVKPRDYFFQCTDGVLENVNDDALCQILESEETNDKKLQLLLNLCDGNTRDNYSGYLVQVADNEPSKAAKEWIEPMQAMAASSDNTVKFKKTIAESEPVASSTPAETPKSNRGLWYLGILVLISAISLGAYFLQKKKPTPTLSETAPSPTLEQEAIIQSDTSKPIEFKPRSTSSLPIVKVPHLSAKLKAATSAAVVDTTAKPTSKVITPNSTAFGKAKKDTALSKTPGG